MKLNCGLTEAEKEAEFWERVNDIKSTVPTWETIFAWVPVRVGRRDCRWLEAVERRRVEVDADWISSSFYWFEIQWEYRSVRP